VGQVRVALPWPLPRNSECDLLFPPLPALQGLCVVNSQSFLHSSIPIPSLTPVRLSHPAGPLTVKTLLVMSVHLNRKLAITLLFSLALLLAFARPSSANAISPDSPSRRDHHNLNRMIKRRVAAPPVARQITGNNPGGAIGAGANPPEDKSSSTPSSTPSSPSPAAQPSSLVTSASGLLSSSVALSSAVSHFPFPWRIQGYSSP
jgi:hypothetical protein